MVWIKISEINWVEVAYIAKDRESQIYLYMLKAIFVSKIPNRDGLKLF